MTDDVELLPCPFCGGEVEKQEGVCVGDADYIVHKPVVGGHSCGNRQFSNFTDGGDVAALWNTRAAIAALTASSGWRTIDSAPKDGTSILIHCPRARRPVCEAWWAQDYEGGPGFWMTPMGPQGRGYTILPEAVTDWQPLPPPPGTEQPPSNEDRMREALEKLKDLRAMCESCCQPFYVQIIDEVCAALGSGGEG